MYTISRIHSLIKPAMCGTFQRHVDACEADKYSKKFSCHELLVTMLFATFSNSKSLRILELNRPKIIGGRMDWIRQLCLIRLFGDSTPLQILLAECSRWNSAVGAG